MLFKKILVEQLNPESDFAKILALKKGNVDRTDIEFDIDEIYSMDGKYLYFNFDDAENFLQFFLGENDDDNYGVMNQDEISNWEYYLRNGFSYNDTDGYEYDDYWDGGYILDSLNEENKNKIKDLVQLFLPDHIELTNTENGKFVKSEELSKLLSSLEGLKDNLIEKYGDASDYAKIEGSQEYLDGIGSEIVEPLGFEQDGKYEFSYYKISLSDLVLLYSRFGSANDSLYEVLRRSSNKLSKFAYDNPLEVLYESWDSDAFDRGFQNSAGRIVNQFIEELIDNEYNSEKYNKVFSEVSKTHGINKRHMLGNSTESDNKDEYKVTSYEVLGIDPFSLKLKVDFKSGYRRKIVEMTLDDLNKIVKNHALFDIM